MKTLCVIVTFRPVVEPHRPLGGQTIVEWLSRALDQALAGIPRVAVGPLGSPSEYIGALRSAADGFDEVVVVAADGPFLRPDVMTQMLALHREYRADYTFADGYPAGLTPEILRPSILSVLGEWAAGKAGPVERDTLFQLLSTDINRFDVETQLSPVDLRSRRLSFTADSKRNRLLLERYADDQGLETGELLNLVSRTAGRTRTLPATLHVQITNGVLQIPVWSPLEQFVPDAPQNREFLSRERWNDLLDRALRLAGDLTVLPSFWGEPSLHPEISALLSDALDKPGLKLCVETSGLGWGRVDLEALSARSSGNLDWIVELDSNVPETYRKLRGDGFEEAQGFAQRLVPMFPGHVWPQTVRMQENEAEMEQFHSSWKERAGQVIIQKHNDFGGRLPRAKPSDLSPWKRHPCWHVARDLAVFLDGTAVVCRDDFARTQPLGNVWTDSLEHVWNQGSALWALHVGESWPAVCQNCDEWYTFHF